MAVSLYDASVSSYLQTLTALGRCLDLGLAHFREHGIDPAEIVEARLVADMRPFRFQVRSVVHHSLDAAEALKTGVFRPPGPTPDDDYADLQALIVDACDALLALTPADINVCEGTEVVFEVRTLRRVFTAERFLLSYSLPNFYFHATTAYDILRVKGVPIGKLDYLGALRLKA